MAITNGCDVELTDGTTEHFALTAEDQINIATAEKAVQAGAISDNMLMKFLNSSDSSEVVKRAMPKTATTLSPAKLAKAKAMLNIGATYEDIARACGVPKSTIYDALNK